LSGFAVRTGLEPATPCVTGRYSNQLNYRTVSFIKLTFLAICFPYKVCKCRLKYYFVNTLAKKKFKNERLICNTLFYCMNFLYHQASRGTIINNTCTSIGWFLLFRIIFVTLHPQIKLWHISILKNLLKNWSFN
jgi:hypothetical protein